MPPAPPQLQRPIAAFDFDGTLSHRDSVEAFLRFSVGNRHFYGRLLQNPHLLLAAFAGKREGNPKISIINNILRLNSDSHFRALVQEFFASHRENIFRPDALEAWKEHGRLGHERIIVTGSMAPLIQPFAELLGADRLIATEVSFDSQSLKLILNSPNCVRAEKARRLKAIYGNGIQLHSAYGDSRGDYEMLEMAAHNGFKTFMKRPPSRTSLKS